MRQIFIKEWSSVFVFKEYGKLLDERVEFLDTKELNKTSIDLKMRGIMQDFGLKVDSKNCNDVLMANYFKGSAYLWLPLEMKVGLENKDIKILFLNIIESKKQCLCSLASEI